MLRTLQLCVIITLISRVKDDLICTCGLKRAVYIQGSDQHDLLLQNRQILLWRTEEHQIRLHQTHTSVKMFTKLERCSCQLSNVKKQDNQYDEVRWELTNVKAVLHFLQQSLVAAAQFHLCGSKRTVRVHTLNCTNLTKSSLPQPEIHPPHLK